MQRGNAVPQRARSTQGSVDLSAPRDGAQLTAAISLVAEFCSGPQFLPIHAFLVFESCLQSAVFKTEALPLCNDCSDKPRVSLPIRAWRCTLSTHRGNICLQRFEVCCSHMLVSSSSEPFGPELQHPVKHKQPCPGADSSENGGRQWHQVWAHKWGN